MKLRTLPIALAAAIICVPAIAADATPPSPGVMAGQPEKPTPKTPEAWIERMTDFTQNMSAFKDPRAFVPWSQAVTEPSFYTAMGSGMMDPSGWLRMMNTMQHPDAFKNMMMFADPNVAMKWMQAGMDPAFYNALITQFSDPGKMMRWAMMPMDPKTLGMMLQPMNPNLYMRWAMTPMDPRAWNMMMQPMNPNLYMSWLGTMMKPQTYGPTWANWLNAPASPIPSGAPGGMNMLPFPLPDLSSMLPGFGAPGATAPRVAAAPAPAPATVPFFGIPLPTVPVATPASAATLVLGADALFPIGKGDVRSLSAEGKKKLEDYAAQVKAAGNVKKIVVTGHADKSGKAGKNMVLSRQRANSVKAYLVAKGIKAKMIEATGKGDTQPVTECDMKMERKALAECLAPNRRVEVETVTE